MMVVTSGLVWIILMSSQLLVADNKDALSAKALLDDEHPPPLTDKQVGLFTEKLSKNSPVSSGLSHIPRVR